MKISSQEVPRQDFAGYVMDRDTPNLLKSMARDHWAKYRPKMYSRLQSTGVLEDLLERAVEFTREDMRVLESHLKTQGYSDVEAKQQAWEELQAKWILLPQEK
jgi:hypothetical protein